MTRFIVTRPYTQQKAVFHDYRSAVLQREDWLAQTFVYYPIEEVAL